MDNIEKIEKPIQGKGENNEDNYEHLITPSTIEHDTQGIGLQEINTTAQEIKRTQEQKIAQKDK